MHHELFAFGGVSAVQRRPHHVQDGCCSFSERAEAYYYRPQRIAFGFEVQSEYARVNHFPRPSAGFHGEDDDVPLELVEQSLEVVDVHQKLSMEKASSVNELLIVQVVILSSWISFAPVYLSANSYQLLKESFQICQEQLPRSLNVPQDLRGDAKAIVTKILRMCMSHALVQALRDPAL